RKNIGLELRAIRRRVDVFHGRSLCGLALGRRYSRGDKELQGCDEPFARDGWAAVAKHLAGSHGHSFDSCLRMYSLSASAATTSVVEEASNATRDTSWRQNRSLTQILIRLFSRCLASAITARRNHTRKTYNAGEGGEPGSCHA